MPPAAGGRFSIVADGNIATLRAAQSLPAPENWRQVAS
jgi:hypothetical protein